MGFVGIDRNYKQDAFIGLTAGIGFVVLNKVSAQFVLGLPAIALSVGQLSQFVVTAMAAPAFEETFFRGVLPGTLQSLFHNKTWWLFNIAQATLFALFHYAAYGVGFQTAFVGAFLFGLVAGLITKYTNSILPSILMHSVFNSYLWLMSNVSFGGI